MSKKLILISALFLISILAFSCAGQVLNVDLLIGSYSSVSNGSLVFEEDGSLTLTRGNGNLGAIGTWGSKSKALVVNFFTLYDTDGENEYNEFISYEYHTACFDGNYFAPISSINSNDSLEGVTWNLGMIKRYNQSANVDNFLSLELGMSFTFQDGELTVTYSEYKEYNDAGTLIYDAVKEGEITEVIPYTVEDGKIMLDYPPLPDYIFAGSRLGEVSYIDYTITEDGKLLLYYYDQG